MASCCTQSPSKKYICPQNKNSYLHVPQSTVLQHIKTPWKTPLKAQYYYFCDDPECDVVYFGSDDSVINKSELRSVVGIKEQSNKNALICYCFDISYSQIKENNELKQFVIQQTKDKLCSCEVQNPSGRCCLKDFPKNCNG